MASATQSDIAEPDLFYVGKDCAGHWLVQDRHRRLEGRFVSFSAALRFAEAERQSYHAGIELATVPLIPIIPFSPVAGEPREAAHGA